MIDNKLRIIYIIINFVLCYNSIATKQKIAIILKN